MTIPFRTFAVAAVFAFAGVARAQDVPVEKYTLSNGLTVILHEDHSRPIAAVNIWYRVGAKDEPARRSGFAHLFEHLMFMGTQRVPTGEFDRVMEAEGGSNNASTGLDRTNYYSSGPASLLPTLLWLDADRLEDLARTMDQQKLDLQRDVVLNELRQSIENQPYGRTELNIQYLLYPPSHPYHFPPIGTEEDLKAAAVSDVKDFFATFYHPANASLVVAGDFDPRVIKPLIADLFGTLARRPEPPRKPAEPVRLESVKRGSMYDQVQLPMLSFVYHSPPIFADGDAECDLLASILADGKASRLYARLVTKEKLATSVSANRDQGKLGSPLRIDVLARPDADLDLVETIVDEELSRISTDGPSQAELDHYKASIELRKLESIEHLEARADKLNEYEFYLGSPNSFQRDVERYRGATTASVQRWARLVLTPGARVLYRVLPVQPQRGQTARDQRPSDFKPAPFTPPAPATFILADGVKVMCWEMPGVPLESVGVVFTPGGALNAPDGSDSGLGAITARMMTEGAGDLDGAAFEQAIESLGGSYGIAAGSDSLHVEMTVLARNFDRASLLLADALRRPRFAADDFDRVRKLTLDELRQSEDDPRAAAGRVAARALYGPNHPLAWPVHGTPVSVARFNLGDVHRMYQRLVRPSSATIVAAGSLSRTELQSSLEKALADWRDSANAEPFAAATPPPSASPRLLIVNRPGAVQTVVEYFSPGVNYADESRVPLGLLNTILGSSFTSRLNQNLREKHGYTYGARSAFDFSKTSGTFRAGASVTTKVTGPSLTEFASEFARLKSGDVSAEEAGKAAKFARTRLVESFASTAGVVSVGAGLVAHGATFESLIADSKRTEALTDAELNALARKFAWTDAGVLVLVGDREAILEQLKDLKLPAPIDVDSYGNPAPVIEK